MLKSLLGILPGPMVFKQSNNKGTYRELVKYIKIIYFFSF